MTHTFNISGMTCSSCTAKVKSELLKIGDVTSADVQLTSPQARITMEKHIPPDVLQKALQKAGTFAITAADDFMQDDVIAHKERSWFSIYKPVLLVLFYVLMVTLINAVYVSGVNWMRGMRIFMSGFFITFSFFKMLDLEGFADSYSGYDLISKVFHNWGYCYAFIELALGIAFAVNFKPLMTNIVTVILMTVSIIGVAQAVLDKRKIKCACLGAVFNLPMSTVTIIEDGVMIAMSGIMIVCLFNN